MAKFKKGKSGNPSGRPKGKKYVSEILKELVGANNIRVKYTFNDEREREISIGSDKEIGYLIAVSMIRKAIKGDVTAFREIMDRIEGKPSLAEDDKNNEMDIKINFGQE